MEFIMNRKVIYFGDMMLSGNNDTIEEEFENEVHPQFKRQGIVFDKVQCMDMPPTGETYDILLFDWGGASLGNSFMDSFCRYIERESKEYPNRLYIIVSTFTMDAMRDALKEGLIYPNIFLTIRDFCEYWKTLK